MTGVRVVVQLLLAAISFTASLPSSPNEAQPKPHIILIVADDLGWNDVSWHNPQAMTPRLEELAKSGVLLNQSYVQPICTPTRSALLTGRYPFTLGRQFSVLWPEEPTGLSMKRHLLPQALKDVGYSTHAVGKWHLGFCSWDYTPTSRGFDTFWGYYTGAEDYYHHARGCSLSYDLSTDNCTFPNESNNNETSTRFGFDFRNNTVPAYSVDGEYSTYLFSSYIENLLETRSPSDPMFLYLPFQSVHAPLQVPENYTKPFAHIKNHKRRIKLGMVLAMDEAVGRIVDALKTSGHYNNSVIVFTTDNGGPTVSAGNNWPLRGNKSTLWEGGTRGAAFVHSPLLPQKGIVSNKLIHITDWFSTLAGLGGGEAPKDTNGYNQWEAITTSAPSPRKEMIYNIDINNKANAGIRMGDYKLLVGDPGPGDWTPPPEGDMNPIHLDSFPSDDEIMKSRHVFEESEFLDSEQRISFRKGEPRISTKFILQSKKHLFGPFVMAADFGSGYEDIESEEEDLFEKIQEEMTVVKKDIERLRRIFVEREDSNVAGSTLKSHENDIVDVEEGNDLVTVRDLGLNANQHTTLGQLISNDTTLRLYNIAEDPEERNNLASEKKEVVMILLGLLHHYMKDYVPPDIFPDDPQGNPRHWNNTWTPGWCHSK